MYRDLNRLDNAKSAKATDALLNYETVKYFSNEAHERTQFAVAIGDYQRVEYLLLASLSALNIVQSLIIFVGLAAGLTVCANVRNFPPTFPVSSTPQLIVQEGLECATLSEHSHGCVHHQLCGPGSSTRIPSCVLQGVSQGTLTVGDAVLFLSLLQQLYAPLNYFGSYYR